MTRIEEENVNKEERRKIIDELTYSRIRDKELENRRKIEEE